MTIGDKVGQAGSYAREKAASARQAASGAVQGARQRASTARSTGSGQLEESPLIALVGGLALGAIAAAVLPRTQREQQMLGGVGGKLTESAKNAAQAAREAGRSKLDELGLKDTLSSAVRDVAGTAAGAAKGAATSGAGGGTGASKGTAGDSGVGQGSGGSSGLAGTRETSTSSTFA